MIRYVPWLLVCVTLGIIGQMLLKSGSLQASEKTGLKFYLSAFASFPTLAGLFCYVVSSLLWIYLLRVVPLSWAYPMISISYVVVVFLSRLFFQEPISAARWAGVFLICSGVILVARS